LQVPLAHCVPSEHGWPVAARQFPLPSQASVVVQLAAGSSVPAVSIVQVPVLPTTSHARHAPTHAESQHTPSTQLPLAHSRAAPQVVPVSFFAVQTPPVAQ
jgi:hypothetical protein